MSRPAASLIALAILLRAEIAAAHSPIEGIGGFYSGLVHPLVVPAHLLVLVGLGLWLGQQPLDRVRLAVTFFAAILIAALAMSQLVPEGTLHDSVLLAIAACVGGLTAAAVSLPRLVLIAFTAVAAVGLGLDSSADVAGIRDAIIAATGTWVGSNLILLNIAAVTSLATRAWMKVGVRVLGSWTTASALLVLALELRR